MEITETEIRLPRLPAELDGLRAVHLSDFHLGHWVGPEYMAACLERAMGLKPDILLLTGDFVCRTHKELPPFREMFSHLNAPLGVWGVLGNHDHETGAERMAGALRECGIRLLTNESLPFPGAKGGFYLAGIDDPITGASSLEKAFESIPQEAGTLLLSHAPDIAPLAACMGADLILSGHTHGGQVLLPRLGAPAGLISETHRTPYRGGLYRLEGTQVYVTRGLGVTFLPIRWGCPPEISLLALRRQKEG
ncbi:MAG: metallophosphoesterase [Armatimonadetes bacterium]|nr:metallophosphoesterase [Armatimonadota bacterium]